MPSLIVLSLVGAGATYAFLWALAYLNQDPREPQPIAGSIPFLSPLVGLMMEKESFYMRMRQAISSYLASLRVQYNFLERPSIADWT